MNAREPSNPSGGPIPDARIAEAGVWIARIHGDSRDSAQEAGLRRWLHEDPINARAFELATEVWVDAENLRRVVSWAPQPAPAKAAKTQPWRLTLAAGLTAALVLAFVLFQPGPGVSTDLGEQRALTLEDGTRVFLNTDTQIVVHYDDTLRRVELKSGEALFNVAKNPQRPFVVTAGDREVKALGTSFVVRKDERQIAVTLVEGEVSIRPLAPQAPVYETFTLTPGQRMTFAVGAPPRLDTPPLEASTAWRRGQVVLDDTPLSTAAMEMNRYSATKLVIAEPEIQQVRVSGLFQAGDSVSFANAVAGVHNLRVTQEGDEIILSAQNNN